jgi:CheY-like chemotaxis protein
VTVLAPAQQITLPMTGDGAVFDFRGPFPDGDSIHDLTTAVSTHTRMPRAAYPPLGPKVLNQLFFQHSSRIRTLLAENHVCVCGEAMDGEEALEKVRKLKPDIVLLDINMPVMNGIQAAYEIRRMAPSTKVIFLTIQNAPETAAVMRLLAVEFVCKSASGTDLIPIVGIIHATLKTGS